MALSVSLALAGAVAALAATVLLVVHYGAGERPLVPLVGACSAALKEIECKSRQGLLGEAEADAARSAALGRFVDALRAAQSRWWLLRGDRSALVIVALAAMSFLAFGGLGATAEDGDRPAARSLAAADAGDGDVARLAAYAQSVPLRTPPGGKIDAGTGKELPDVETLIERLAARLESAPDDADGWRMLGWALFHTQQPRKAAEAYERALALRPASADFMVAYGEALAAAEAGSVTAKAAERFDAALQIDPANTKARYFRALAKQQAGQKKEALDEWLSLQAEDVKDEPWAADLRERTKALARELGVAVPALVGSAPSASSAKTANVDPPGQPTAEATRAMEALPADQQQTLVRGMVEGLANRLDASPRDEAGWIRLMRSRVVLGEEPAAREALKRALAAFADDGAAQARLVSAASELGISGK